MPESKNAKLLAEFTEYCQAHPEQRFWQALRNWSEFDSIVARKQSWDDVISDRDTFYWENKND